MKVADAASVAIFAIFLYHPDVCMGWLGPPLKSDVPMDHGLVEFRIRETPPAPPPRSFRLPKSISPIHYDLEIRPIIDSNNTYGRQYYAPGKVTIRIKCLNATSSVILHARWLEIQFSKIEIHSLSTARVVRVTGFNMDAEDDRHFFTIFFDSDLTVNAEYLLTIPFTAIVAYPEARLSGIYRTTYDGSDGTRKTLVVTQFQKSDAREAFPCFDEPSFQFKATFSIKIGRLSTYMTFSNMEKVGEPEPIPDCPGWVWDTYAKTVKIPIYAVAFAVANDYAADASPEANRILLQTWVPKILLKNDSLKHTVRASSRIFKFYEELFDFQYPVSKLENFAAPMDLWGMENLGLVTYRPFFLLWNAKENTQFEKWQSVSLIAHEFVHMWFGNLVTCEWWHDYWLNEGFARYFQFVGAQIAGENFRATDRFVTDVVQWAMALDEGPASVPVHGTEMERVTYSPLQIEYDKAAALIRMMATFLTQETFLCALKVYLKKHQYSNTVQDDLFQAMTNQAVADGTLTHLTVKEIMDTWTQMRGFPVIRVSRADNDTVYISQHRFVHHPSSLNIESGLWCVPIWYTTKSNPDFQPNITTPQLWMDKDTIVTYFHIPNTDEWLIVNPEARGYYRVIYDDHFTNLIIAQLEEDHTVFNFATRSQLIDDHFRSAQARYIGIRYAMDMTCYLSREDDLMVWTTVLNNFRALHVRLVDTSIINHFRTYILGIVIPPLNKIGIKQQPTDSPSTIMLRGQLLDWACSLEHELCTEYAKEMFALWMANPDGENPIPTDYQPQIYCAAVAGSSNLETHNFLLKHYKQTKSPRQRNLAIRALSCDQNKDVIHRLLIQAIDINGTDINAKQHGSLLLDSLATSTVGRNMTWNFIKDRHKSITNFHYPMTVPWLVSTLAPYASSKGLSKMNVEITTFISHYLRNGKIGKDSLQTSASKIVENSYWMEYFFHDVQDWLILHTRP